MTENPWDWYWKTKFNKYPNEQLVRFVTPRFQDAFTKHYKALDLGCGVGTQTLFLADAGFDTYAIDGSETAIETARKRFEDHTNKAIFEKRNMTDLPFKDATFDLVVDNSSIQHNTVEDIGKILKEVRRVLTPNGLFWSFCRADDDSLNGHGDQVEFNTYTVRSGDLKNTGVTHFFNELNVESVFGLHFLVSKNKVVRYLDYAGKNEQRVSHWELWCRPK